MRLCHRSVAEMFPAGKTKIKVGNNKRREQAPALHCHSARTTFDRISNNLTEGVFDFNRKSALSPRQRAATYFKPKISSEEQSNILHNLANVPNDGKIFPDRYCKSVGLDIPSSSAICDLLLPQFVLFSYRSPFIALFAAEKVFPAARHIIPRGKKFVNTRKKFLFVSLFFERLAF